ncbi:hypothetical protein GQ600_11005 [Phytophthora cactorum]|nr:hypothetical protein GQ600_11005 [Phytophthora cactorum]
MMRSERGRGRSDMTTQCHSSHTVGKQVEHQDLQRLQRIGHTRSDGSENERNLAKVGRQQEAHEALDVAVDFTTLLDGGDDAAEVIVRKDHRRRIVDTVAGHGCHVALTLQRLDDLDLVFWLSTGKHRDLAGDFIQLSIRQIHVLTWTQHTAIHSLSFSISDSREQVNITSNSHCRLEVVASDHNSPDRGFTSRVDGILHTLSRGIDGGNESHKD